MDEFQEAAQDRKADLLERWLRMTPWACSGGLRGTAQGARATLFETTDQFLRLVEPGHQVKKLKALKEVLIRMQELEDWVDGSPWKSRGICKSCGTLYREESGPCRDGPTGCKGEVEPAGEDGYVIDARSAQNRLTRKLSELLGPAEVELRAIVLAGKEAEPRATDEPRPSEPNEKRGIADNSTKMATPEGKLLLGWRAILKVLGVDYERKNRVRMKRMNARRDGPITWVGNAPKVHSGPLLRWIQDLDQKREDDDSAGRTDVAAELNHPAEMKKLGFQPKVRPNNPGSFSRKVDPIP